MANNNRTLIILDLIACILCSLLELKVEEKRKTFHHQDSFQFSISTKFCCLFPRRRKQFSRNFSLLHFEGKLNLSDGVGIYLMTLNDVYRCTQQRAFSQALIVGSINTG